MDLRKNSWIVIFKVTTCLKLFSFPVTEGEVSFKLTMSPDMAPLIQFVAYAVLPSKNVIAHSAEFSTEKCFSNKVSRKENTSHQI